MNVIKLNGEKRGSPMYGLMAAMLMRAGILNNMSARLGEQERKAPAEKPSASTTVTENKQLIKAPATPVMSTATKPPAAIMTDKGNEKKLQQEDGLSIRQKNEYRQTSIWQESMKRLGALGAKQANDTRDKVMPAGANVTQKAAYEAGREAGRADREKKQNEERIISQRQGYDPDYNRNE